MSAFEEIRCFLRLISCISWFISAIQQNSGQCSYVRNVVYLNNRHCLLRPPEINISEHFRGQIWLSFSLKFPEEALMSLYWGLGKERPAYRRLLKQCTCKVPSKFLTTLKDFFTLLCCFILFLSFSYSRKDFHCLSNRGCNSVPPNL